MTIPVFFPDEVIKILSVDATEMPIDLLDRCKSLLHVSYIDTEPGLAEHLYSFDQEPTNRADVDAFMSDINQQYAGYAYFRFVIP